MQDEVIAILEENERRNAKKYALFNPLTGEGSVGERKHVHIPDFEIKDQWLPVEMLKNPTIKAIIKYGSIAKYLESKKLEPTEENYEFVSEKIVRIRSKHDFCFWAIVYVIIKDKEGDDIPFKLNRQQRRVVERFEEKRKAGKPIRLILLKARQWGGSTVIQIYMAWLQLVHKKGCNSLIVGHVKDASAEVKGMYDKMLMEYPMYMLHNFGEHYNENETKVEGVDGTANIKYIPLRNCKIKIGTAERPDSARGGDSALVHCTEVAFWKKTDGKTPQQIVRSACSGVSQSAYTMIVYESTANGTGNFFQVEYDAAKSGKSKFEALFVAWFEIERYSEDIEDIEAFAKWLYENRNNTNVPDERHDSGVYYWKLWEMGATLEAINWYISKRSDFEEHSDMAAEYPSDDIEAFKHSGERVFDQYHVEKLKPFCKPPKLVGDVYADGDEGKEAMRNVRFKEDLQGKLWIWQMPEIFPDVKVTDRYLTVVDVGGRSNKADYSVIVVFDRYWMMESYGKPSVVAQWRGHCDHDILAWKAAQIAAYYNNSLLVIESNTLETKDKDRDVDGDQTSFILNQIKEVYPNLYARKQSEEDILAGEEKKYGFHTNLKTKPMIISTLVKCIREQLYTERDIQCINEYLTYEKKKDGSFGAIEGKHDDILMTRAIGLHICFREMDIPKFIDINKNNTGFNIKPVSLATF